MQVLRIQGSLAFPAATPYSYLTTLCVCTAKGCWLFNQPLGFSASSRGFTERWLGFDHIQMFSSAEPVALAETSCKRTAHAPLTKACCLWPRPIACAVESAFHPSAALLWGKEVILNLSSTVSIPALAFHSQEWPAWSQTRLAHVHILFCLGLREVFFSPHPSLYRWGSGDTARWDALASKWMRSPSFLTPQCGSFFIVPQQSVSGFPGQTAVEATNFPVFFLCTSTFGILGHLGCHFMSLGMQF